ncbi:DUF1036 domain-containing protein [Parvularcula sp. ZS-1/3]|uniref:DUF1036 domain-containing protein n=1 Tax=Parvularcula mediterranea TaxID=2732508 RepID=A0A7Y3RKQ4_9PROT|nr:DUF1036 domain-containing protein [Parvularcula mediterranea]NNU15790.1 DUF1036 domain-containing protein [Parvularcula mediterranea]
MLKLTIRLAAFAIVLAALGTTSARAEYSLCNKTSFALSAALGFVEEDNLLTRGWWRLRPGECKTVISEGIEAGRYYVYAEAIPGHRGELKTWSGETPLCVQNDSLFTLRDQSVCKEDPKRSRDFNGVDVTSEDGGNFTTDFTDENNFTTYQAQVAGVQRLLSDVGFDIGAIDGQFGATTKSALRQYRRSRNLGQDGVIDDQVIDALITEANNEDAKLGFFFCNETLLPVWAAFAQPTDDREGYRSSGWWLLEPDSCAKVRRGELAAEPYYVYGIMQAEDQELVLAGGDTTFCVSAVQFDAGSDLACEASGFDEASFRRIDTGGERAWTFVFRAEQFNQDLVRTEEPAAEVIADEEPSEQ